MGLDPATKKPADLEGQVKQFGCRWSGEHIIVDVLTTTATVAMYDSRTDLNIVGHPVVFGLPSIAFQVPNDPGACFLLSDLEGRKGLMVLAGIKFEHEAAVGVDSCTLATRLMERAAPILLAPR